MWKLNQDQSHQEMQAVGDRLEAMIPPIIGLCHVSVEEARGAEGGVWLHGSILSLLLRLKLVVPGGSVFH
jgi:hypothetical protein